VHTCRWLAASTIH